MQTIYLTTMPSNDLSGSLRKHKSDGSYILMYVPSTIWCVMIINIIGNIRMKYIEKSFINAKMHENLKTW